MGNNNPNELDKREGNESNKVGAAVNAAAAVPAAALLGAAFALGILFKDVWNSMAQHTVPEKQAAGNHEKKEEGK